jgi:hypothetical protein
MFHDLNEARQGTPCAPSDEHLGHGDLQHRVPRQVLAPMWRPEGGEFLPGHSRESVVDKSRLSQDRGGVIRRRDSHLMTETRKRTGVGHERADMAFTLRRREKHFHGKTSGNIRTARPASSDTEADAR